MRIWSPAIALGASNSVTGTVRATAAGHRQATVDGASCDPNPTSNAVGVTVPTP
jgi:hypothetical protein